MARSVPLGTLVLSALALAATACSSTPPPRWEEGGAVLAIGPARWERARGRPIELLEDGNVLEGKKPIFFVDRAGRVTDDDREPYALLMPDGLVAGPDDVALGHVGIDNAAPPDSASAWVAVLPNGEVVHFDPNGDRHPDGAWRGCEGPVHRTCTLVTHMVKLRSYRDRDNGPSVGIGIGIGL